jgi:hypothetical protein
MIMASSWQESEDLYSGRSLQEMHRKAQPVVTRHGQIEVEPAREEQDTGAERYGVLFGSILVLAALAVIYTLYLGTEILLPLALAIVLKLLLQPAMRLLQERLRLPGPLAALFLLITVFGAIAAVALTISVPASRWIERRRKACHYSRRRFQSCASLSIICSIGSTSWRT